MKKILPKVLAVFLIVALVSCASSKKSSAKEEPPLSVTTQDKTNDLPATDAPVVEPKEASDVSPTYIDSGIEKIEEPGMMVVEETDGLSDSLTSVDRPVQLHEVENKDNVDEEKINAEVEKWLKAHSLILNKNANSITSNDLGIIQKAISDYGNLSAGAKNKLQKEYNDLQNKLAKAKSLAEAEAKKAADAKAKAAADAKAKADADAKKAAESKIDAEVAKWKQAHSAILNKNANSVTTNDLSAIQKAISDYGNLSAGAKNKLQKEYKDLQNKLAKAKADAEAKAKADADAKAKADADKKAKDAGNTLSVSDNGDTAKVATNTQPRGHIVLDNAQFYTVRRGDRLILIAKRFYGSEKGNYFPFIIAGTEEKIEDPDLIEIGQKLTIPDLQAAVSTEESRNYVKQTFYDVADKYEAKGKPGMASQLRAIAAGL